MRSFLTWLVLGLLLFLSSCTQTRYSVHAYRLTRSNPKTKKLLNSVEPVISYGSKIDAFYNDDFKLSFVDDVQMFYSKVDAYAEQKHRNETKLSATDMYQALSILDEPENVRDMSSLRQFALSTEQSY